MLIHLVPKAPAGPVTFTLVFPNTPEQHSLPASWSSQLQALEMDDLDFPPCLLALDVAVGTIALLDKVLIDMVIGKVVCDYVDGYREEWDVAEERRFFGQVDKVVSDVEDSKDLMLKDEERKRARREAATVAVTPTAPHPQKHKKGRSVFASLWTSVFPASKQRTSSRPENEASISSAANTPSLTLTSSSLPSTPSAQGPQGSSPINITTQLTPRLLRRRARMTLVDIFRRYVLPELAKRAHPGGYHAWAAQSMLRQTDAQMEDLLAEAAGNLYAGDESVCLSPRSEEEMVAAAAQRRAKAQEALKKGLAQVSARGLSRSSSSSTDEDEDEQGTEDDDAQEWCPDTPDLDNDSETLDGSSIHTPRSSYFSHASGSLRSTCGMPLFLEAELQRHGSLSSSCNPLCDADTRKADRSKHKHAPKAPSAELIARYTALTRQAARLKGLLLGLANHEEQQNTEKEEILASFEVKSRRRAWLNKAFIGYDHTSSNSGSSTGPSTSMQALEEGALPGVYLAMPVQGSPLARGDSVTAESLREVGIVVRAEVDAEVKAAWAQVAADEADESDSDTEDGDETEDDDDADTEDALLRARPVIFPRISSDPEEIVTVDLPDDLEAIGGGAPLLVSANKEEQDEWGRARSQRVSSPPRLQVRVRPRTHGMRLLERLHLQSLVVEETVEADPPLPMCLASGPQNAPSNRTNDFAVNAIMSSISEAEVEDDVAEVMMMEDDGPFDPRMTSTPLSSSCHPHKHHHRHSVPVMFGKADMLEVETKVSIAFDDEEDHDSPRIRQHDDWQFERSAYSLVSAA